MPMLTSESVTEGHPDKVCDQISDAILDAYLHSDPFSRVAVEVMATSVGITIGGEVTSQAEVDVTEVARRTLRRIGYTAESGLDPDRVAVSVQMTSQSREISSGVIRGAALGAGDQGMMIGYATDETPEYMPLPLMLSRDLTTALTKARRDGTLPWLRPDGKAQVTVKEGSQLSVDTVVLSTQHHPDIHLYELRSVLEDEVIAPTMARRGLSYRRAMVNPAGEWTAGGPASDTGLTGRKIIVDTYGGSARHGGGAFSGKDATKVDRSAAYAARQAALYLVEQGLVNRCEVHLSYAIGHPYPISVRVDGAGAGGADLLDIITSRYDFTPAEIIRRLGLRHPVFEKTASNGHFGHKDFEWENP